MKTKEIKVINADLDFQMLDKLLDRAKTPVFMSKHSTFLGSLMCSLNFVWTSDIQTAGTNGLFFWWNPYWFLKLPIKTRITVVMHELWHVACLDMLRRGDRNPKIWNWACDIRINNRLKAQGYSFEGTDPWIDGMTDEFGRKMLPRDFGDTDPETIYDEIKDIDFSGCMNIWGHEEDDEEDIIEPDDKDGSGAYPVVNKVVGAASAAVMAGGEAGDMPSDVQTILKKFLNPKLPWNVLLLSFFNELQDSFYSLKRPNRRFHDMYLSSLLEDEGGLVHLAFFEDVSGSITDGQAHRFNSEVKYIKETFDPEILSIIQFDTIIQKIDVFEREDIFDEIVIQGRGGTSLICVRDWIIENKPTAVVIFSDLCCVPMEPLPPEADVPIIWIAINNTGATVPHGKLVHMRE